MDDQIGAQIKARRKELGMSQGQLADLLGVSFQQVQKYEGGTNRVAASRLWRISTVLDRPISWFFMSEAANEATAPSERDWAQLRGLFASLDKAGRKQVLSLAQSLAKPG